MEINENTKNEYRIIFYQQYLKYFGFILVFISFILILIINPKTYKNFKMKIIFNIVLFFFLISKNLAYSEILNLNNIYDLKIIDNKKIYNLIIERIFIRSKQDL